MEKIKLKNGQEFELVPMGINSNELYKKRTFKFVSELDYEEVKNLFLNRMNLEEVEHILADGSKHTYLDCAKLKELSQRFSENIGNGTTADIYIAEVSTDTLERDTEKTKENITLTEIALTEIYETMLGGGL